MFKKTKLLSILCPWLLPRVAYIFRAPQKHIFHQRTYIFQTKNKFLCLILILLLLNDFLKFEIQETIEKDIEACIKEG